MNKLNDRKSVTCDEYLEIYKTQVHMDSEKMFIRDFLSQIITEEALTKVVPQYPFIDSEGHHRQIDFAIVDENGKIAFEIDGENYHAEGALSMIDFDDSLYRQNEILVHDWKLFRISYNQLNAPEWRQRMMKYLETWIAKYNPFLLKEIEVKPNTIQKEVLKDLEYYRSIGWKKGLVIMPTGTGKTYLAALDSYRFGGKKTLFVVHKIDILTQAAESFMNVWKDKKFGYLGDGQEENIHDCDILFASKDTLYKPERLNEFSIDEFDYIIVDEVHHGEAPTYKSIFQYFKPKFLLGVTATPDRTDKQNILELFDYNKVSEYDINDAIDKGFLVSYKYYGLTDNIDYSKIKKTGKKYNVSDLERTLIVDKRNQAIFDKYIELVGGDKAIAFCVTIEHAKKMADFFNERGVSSIAITSSKEDESKPSKELIKEFKNNEYAVAFTVDKFNEGIDVPNVRALLFLRPTESKTVFTQQLGRGLRLSPNKEELIVLDFIGNYKKANKKRKWLACSRSTRNTSSGAYEKIVYNYNPKCDVVFDEEIEQLLDLQDRTEHDASKEDLIDEYWKVTDLLDKKPSIDDINNEGFYKVGTYVSVFGSWIKFLREIGQTTESSFHYPQGFSIGHMLYILKVLYEGKRAGTYLDNKFIRIRGNLEDEELGRFQRQVKYKLQGMMEMGLVMDDRQMPEEPEELYLTEDGKKFYKLLKPCIDGMDFRFKKKKGKNYSSEFVNDDYKDQLVDYVAKAGNEDILIEYRSQVYKMDAVRQLMEYFYKDLRNVPAVKKDIYKNFFKSPTVTKYCERNGIDPPTETGAAHRLPFLLNLLETMRMLHFEGSNIVVDRFLIGTDTVKLDDKESVPILKDRKEKLIKKKGLTNKEIIGLKEKYGKEFMTDDYFLKEFDVIKEE